MGKQRVQGRQAVGVVALAGLDRDAIDRFLASLNAELNAIQQGQEVVRDADGNTPLDRIDQCFSWAVLSLCDAELADLVQAQLIPLYDKGALP